MRQRDLGAICDMDSTHISRIENGHVDPTLTTAKKIADALEVTVEELFQLEGAAA